MTAHGSMADTIIREALRLFRAKGYYNTSMAEIGHATGLLKGSIYHYFASKDDLMVAVLEYVQRRFEETVFVAASDEAMTPKARLDFMVDAVAEYFSDTKGSVMGILALEATDINPRFRAMVIAFFQRWAQALAHVLESKYPPDRARQLGEDAVAMTEGAIVWTRAFGDVTLLSRISARIKALL